VNIIAQIVVDVNEGFWVMVEMLMRPPKLVHGEQCCWQTAWPGWRGNELNTAENFGVRFRIVVDVNESSVGRGDEGRWR
jgi:hypothetical protein